MPDTKAHETALPRFKRSTTSHLSESKPRSRTALESYGGPAGRIHKGAVTGELMEVFKSYRWASQVLVEGANDEGTLAQIIVAYGRAEVEDVDRWREKDEFFHRAFLAFADWECHSLPKSRPSFEQLSGLFQAAAKKRVPPRPKDAVGNDLITSSRTLGGRNATELPMRPPHKLTTIDSKPKPGLSRRGKTGPRASSPKVVGSRKKKARKPQEDTDKPKRSLSDYNSSRSYRSRDRKRYEAKPRDSRRGRSRTKRGPKSGKPFRSRSRSRSRTTLRKPTSPKQASRRRNPSSERRPRQRSRSRNRHRPIRSLLRRRENTPRPWRGRPISPAPRNSRNPRSRTSNSAQTQTPLNENAQNTLILKLLEKTLDRLEPTRTATTTGGLSDRGMRNDGRAPPTTQIKDIQANFQR